jgi:hypothetical protein
VCMREREREGERGRCHPVIFYFCLPIPEGKKGGSRRGCVVGWACLGQYHHRPGVEGKGNYANQKASEREKEEERETHTHRARERERERDRWRERVCVYERETYLNTQIGSCRNKKNGLPQLCCCILIPSFRVVM